MARHKLGSNHLLTSFSIKHSFPAWWMICWSCMEWPSGWTDMITVVGMHHLPSLGFLTDLQAAAVFLSITLKLTRQKREKKDLIELCTIWSLLAQLFAFQVKHEAGLIQYEKIPSCIWRHNSSSFSYQKLCPQPLLWQNKEEESKTNLWKSFGGGNTPCPTQTATLFDFVCGSLQRVHSSCALSVERSDLLACQGKHCSRKQSKSTYLAPLKLLLFSLANLCNSHGEGGKEFDEAYNDD